MKRPAWKAVVIWLAYTLLPPIARGFYRLARIPERMGSLTYKLAYFVVSKVDTRDEEPE